MISGKNVILPYREKWLGRCRLMVVAAVPIIVFLKNPPGYGLILKLIMFL